MADFTMPSGLVLHDFATYLQANNHLIAPSTPRKHTPGSVSLAEAAQPVSTIYISQLTTRCQAKAITTRYDIHEVQGEVYRFEGELHLESGSTNVLTVKLLEVNGEAQLNKKNVKALLAQKALVALDADPEIERNIVKGPKTETTVDENWVGRLLEWYNTLPASSEPPKYIITEVSAGHALTFTGQVLLEGLDSPMTFGDTTPHSSKKGAKAAAARDAVLWLRSQDKMPTSAGPVTKRARMRQHSPPESPEPRRGTIQFSDIDIAAEDVDGQPKSWVQRVDELMPQLGMPIPQYLLFADPAIPSLYSGGASIHGLDAPPGQKTEDRYLIGTVHNVVGRKKAREEVARLVFEMLDAWRKDKIEEQKEMSRGGNLDEKKDVEMDEKKEKEDVEMDEKKREEDVKMSNEDNQEESEMQVSPGKILPGLLTIREKPSV